MIQSHRKGQELGGKCNKEGAHLLSPLSFINTTIYIQKPRQSCWGIPPTLYQQEIWLIENQRWIKEVQFWVRDQEWTGISTCSDATSVDVKACNSLLNAFIQLHTDCVLSFATRGTIANISINVFFCGQFTQSGKQLSFAVGLKRIWAVTCVQEDLRGLPFATMQWCPKP